MSATKKTTGVLVTTTLGNATERECPAAVGPKELQHGMVIVEAVSQHFIEGPPAHGVEYELTMTATMMRRAKERTCVMPLP